MKIRYSILAILVLTALVAILVCIRQALVEREVRRNKAAIENCSSWVLKHLDIGDNALQDYHIAVDRLTDSNGEAYRFVQFAHKIEMNSLILDGVGIEACSGGFPFYFSVTASEDGLEILDHYADNE